jgi:C4-dicarboxylate transporter DctM subunit
MVEWVKGCNLPWWGFLLAINVLLIFLGNVLRWSPSCSSPCPSWSPMIHMLGIDPVHFAIVMTVNMELALITPPWAQPLRALQRERIAPCPRPCAGSSPSCFCPWDSCCSSPTGRT